MKCKGGIFLSENNYFGENTDITGSAEQASLNTEAPPKKSPVLQRTIIISLAIVAAAVLVTVVCRLFFFNNALNTDFFGNSKATVWHYSEANESTADEATDFDYNLTFDNGRLTVDVGTMQIVGSYSIKHITEEDASTIKDGDSKIGTSMMVIENTIRFDGKYTYSVSGNPFSGKTMTLTNVNNENSVFELDSNASDMPEVERSGEFQKDEKLTGKWEYKDELGTITYEFTDDGKFTRTDKLVDTIQTLNGIYTCKDGVFTSIINFGGPSEIPRKYEFKDDSLIIYEAVPDYSTGTIQILPYTFQKNN